MEQYQTSARCQCYKQFHSLKAFKPYFYVYYFQSLLAIVCLTKIKERGSNTFLTNVFNYWLNVINIRKKTFNDNFISISNMQQKSATLPRGT